MLTLELMKTHVVKTSPTVLIREAIDQMDIYQVDSMPVTDEDGRLVGMISEREILAALMPARQSLILVLSELDVSRVDKTVAECMTSALSIYENEDAKVAAATLLNSNMNRIPVVASDGIVVGTLNRIDVFQALLDDLFE